MTAWNRKSGPSMTQANRLRIPVILAASGPSRSQP